MDTLPFNIVDIAILGVVLISALVGFSRGLVREVLAIGAWVGALLATLYGFGHARTFARDYVQPEILADLVAGFAIFIIVLTVLSMLSKMISNRIRDSFASTLDRSLGTIFGVVRGAFIVSAVYLGITVIVSPGAERPEWAKDSRLVPWARYGAELVYQFFGSPDLGFDGFEGGDQIFQKIREKASSVIAPSDKDDETGYKADERKDIEELIDKND